MMQKNFLFRQYKKTAYGKTPNAATKTFNDNEPFSEIGSQYSDSNRRPAHYECAALPTELYWRTMLRNKPVFGLEPKTCALRMRRSTN